VKDLETSLDWAWKYIKARDLIIESSHAQLVVQDLILHQQNQALQVKENKKKEDRTILFPSGKGRCLTDEAFARKIEALTEWMEREEREKLERANTRAQKRALKDAIKAQWKVAKAEWEQRKEEHEKLISQLLAQGTACKDLPKGPT
jgi:hypothetical protein